MRHGCGAQLPETPQSAEPSPAPAAATITPTCMNDELVAAQEICARAKTAVVEMFSHVRMGRALELENISVLVDAFPLRSPAIPTPLSAWHA